MVEHSQKSATSVTISSGLCEVIRLTVGKGRIEFGSGFQFRRHGADDDGVWCFLEHHLDLCHVTCIR